MTFKDLIYQISLLISTVCEYRGQIRFFHANGFETVAPLELMCQIMKFMAEIEYKHATAEARICAYRAVMDRMRGLALHSHSMWEGDQVKELMIQVKCKLDKEIEDDRLRNRFANVKVD